VRFGREWLNESIMLAMVPSGKSGEPLLGTSTAGGIRADVPPALLIVDRVVVNNDNNSLCWFEKVADMAVRAAKTLPGFASRPGGGGGLAASLGEGACLVGSRIVGEEAAGVGWDRLRGVGPRGGA